jgi:Deoxyribonuclease II
MFFHLGPRIRRLLAAFVLGMSFVMPAVAADCVTPSADVVSGAVLRSGPSAQKERVGTLRPGQLLPFLASQASWYRGQQPDGSQVFVSKRWTQITSCPESAEAATVPVVPPPPVSASGPVPLITKDHHVDWWFVFKFNSVKFPGCGAGVDRPSTCAFGGVPKTYSDGQQFVFASSESTRLAVGEGCAGTTEQDPIGATFDEIYNGRYHYLLWNDQFKGDPKVGGCGANCNSPWGHSKGLVAWDDAGNGTVMQVTTPSWPGSGNQEHPRQSDGNTLGCVIDDNVMYSQHFFALRLSPEDLVKLLQALANASIGTDPSELQIVSNGGPNEIRALVSQLGRKSTSTTATIVTLSTHVRLISKPSALQVPPWQLVSSLLGGVSLRVASWWTNPAIYSTTAESSIECWSGSLPPPGRVEIATSGIWNGITFGLKGATNDGNHAKIGVSTDANSALAIFGDMNQQGTLAGNCRSSQNGRGGVFFVVKDTDLSSSVASLIAGDSAPVQ